MSSRILINYSVSDLTFDDRVSRIASKMGGRSNGWTKGRVLVEAIKLLETNIVTSQESREAQEDENDIQ